MTELDYWEECISQAAEECDLTITPHQLNILADAVRISHENYGMAFYSPPPSDRLNDIERKWKAKLAEKEKELEKYRRNAETAIKRALRQHSDDNVSIGEHGEVFRHGGRTEQIQ